MNIDDYQKKALAYRNPTVPFEHTLTHSALGLVGEAVELQSEVMEGLRKWIRLFDSSLNLSESAAAVSEITKKIKFQDQQPCIEKMIRELGDVAYYFVDCCDALGMNASDVLAINLLKLEHRFPEGVFDKERSENRHTEH